MVGGHPLFEGTESVRAFPASSSLSQDVFTAHSTVIVENYMREREKNWVGLWPLGELLYNCPRIFLFPMS
jgi:hypothetical protein